MNIMIAGCGKVGKSLAKQLCAEGHEVVVLDVDEKALQSVTSSEDVKGIQGDCTSIKILKEAGIKKTELLITVTNEDEKNMLACLVARKISDCKTIARVRSPQYAEDIKYIKEDLGLSMSINPERVAAEEMLRLIQIPSALEVDTFAKGKVNLISFVVPEESLLDGIQLKNLPSKLGIPALICMVQRAGAVYIPDGTFEVMAGDKISVTLSIEDVAAFFNKVGIKARHIKNVLIAGGGMMAYYLAEKLTALKINVKLIESDPVRADQLATELSKAMVLCGDATDKSVLAEEDIERMDAVCALMDEDEENILLALYANKYSSAKRMTKIHRGSYEELVEELPVGQVISAKKITADYILRFVRTMQNSSESEVETLYRMMDGKVEALEFHVNHEFSFRDIPLMKLNLKPGTLICSINRGGVIIRPGGRDVIQTGDSVVVVTTQKGINSLGDILIADKM